MEFIQFYIIVINKLDFRLKLNGLLELGIHVEQLDSYYFWVKGCFITLYKTYFLIFLKPI